MDLKKLVPHGETGLRQAKSPQVAGEEPHPRQWANGRLVASGIGSEETYRCPWKCWGVDLGRRNHSAGAKVIDYYSRLLYSSSVGSLFTDYLQ